MTSVWNFDHTVVIFWHEWPSDDSSMMTMIPFKSMQWLVYIFLTWSIIAKQTCSKPGETGYIHNAPRMRWGVGVVSQLKLNLYVAINPIWSHVGYELLYVNTFSVSVTEYSLRMCIHGLTVCSTVFVMWIVIFKGQLKLLHHDAFSHHFLNPLFPHQTSYLYLHVRCWQPCWPVFLCLCVIQN